MTPIFCNPYDSKDQRLRATTLQTEEIFTVCHKIKLTTLAMSERYEGFTRISSCELPANYSRLLLATTKVRKKCKIMKYFCKKRINVSRIFHYFLVLQSEDDKSSKLYIIYKIYYIIILATSSTCQLRKKLKIRRYAIHLIHSISYIILYLPRNPFSTLL